MPSKASMGRSCEKYFRLLLITSILASLSSGCKNPFVHGAGAAPASNATAANPALSADFSFSDVEATSAQDRTWRSACVAATDPLGAGANHTYALIRFSVFNGRDYYAYSKYFFSDSGCHTLVYQIEHDSDIDLGNAVTADGGQVVLQMDVTYLEVDITPWSAATVNLFNSNLLCDSNIWGLGTPEQVGSWCGYPDYGDRYYDLLFLDRANNRIFLGDRSVKTGTTPENRPTALDIANPFAFP